MKTTKRLLSFLLAALMLLPLGCAAFAVGITPEQVLQKMYVGENMAATVEDQAVNGAFRLAEMLVCAASARANTQEDADALDGILAELTDSWNSGGDSEELIAGASAQIFNVLVTIAVQELPGGGQDAVLQKIRQHYAEESALVTSPRARTVVALNQSVQILTVLAERVSSTPDQVKQVEADFARFVEDDKAAGNLHEQLANGARWLFIMEGRYVTLRDGAFAERAESLTDQVAYNGDNAVTPRRKLAAWLYGCVHMSNLLYDELA